jgi:hypothetical protein
MVEMDANEIRRYLKAVPFRPFTVYMPSDKAFRIEHPDFALLIPNGRTLFVAHLNEGTDILDVPLIARIDVQQASLDS